MTILDFYKYAQLATAAYVRAGQLNPEDSLYQQRFAELSSSEDEERLPLSIAQYLFDPANEFGAAVWSVLHYYGGDTLGVEDNTGFAATLFEKEGEKVLAIRGTEILVSEFGNEGGINDEAVRDTWLDLAGAGIGGIGIVGVAINQVVDMINLVGRLYGPKDAEVMQIRAEITEMQPMGTTSIPLNGEIYLPVAPNIPKDLYLSFNQEVGTGLGVLAPGEKITLTGHSLGGHLAYVAAQLFPQLVNENVYAFNGAGVDPASWTLGDFLIDALLLRLLKRGSVVADLPEVLLGSISAAALAESLGEAANDLAIEAQQASEQILDVLKVMLDTPPLLNQEMPKILSLASEDSVPGDDTSVVNSTWTGAQSLGEELAVGTEVNSHSIEQIMDALALQSVLFRIDSSITLSNAKALLDAAHEIEEYSEETLVEAVHKLLIPESRFAGEGLQLPISDASEGFDLWVGKGSIDAREQYHRAILEINEQLDGLVGGPTLSIVSLAEVSPQELLSDLINNASDQANLAYRYALRELNPFVLVGDDSLYDQHNANGELDLYDPSTGKGRITEEWIEDRAAMLVAVNTARLSDRVDQFERLFSYSGETAYKSIGTLGESIEFVPYFDPEGLAQVDRQRVVFGNDAGNLLTGGALNDSLYGGLAPDVLGGGEGRDYLEGRGRDDILLGGGGNDRLVGGKGTDFLYGGEGDDSYIRRPGDGFDHVIDHAGSAGNGDGVGRLIVMDANGNETDLSGDKQAAPSGDRGWAEDADYLYVFDGRIDPAGIPQGRGGLLVLDKTSGDLLFRVEGFANGELGINLITPEITRMTYIGTDGVDTTASLGIPAGSGAKTIFARGGDDYITNSEADDQLYGEGGNDTLIATLGNDELYGGIGDDRLQGGAGNDYLDGGSGIDVARGGEGNDVLVGGEGDDDLSGDAFDTPDELQGNDYLDGENGNDRLVGGGGNDYIVGGAGNDEIDGDGADVAAQYHGNDVLEGGTGADIIIGSGGSDVLEGGADNDQLHGDVDGIDLQYHGEDWLDGGDGPDFMIGGGANDTLLGGNGDDIILGDFLNPAAGFYGDDYLDGGEGRDFMYGGGGADILFGGAGDDQLGGDSDWVDAAFQGNDEIYGEAGDDSLEGYGGDDELFGGAGVDTLYGGTGDDALFGDAEDDYLDGEAGNDYLNGGTGADTLYGRGGDDELNGGSEDDYLDGGAGDDDIDGGAGTDTLYGSEGDDNLSGGIEDDFLSGGSGNDAFRGGAGADTVIGGDGNDIYFFDSGDGADTISDESGDDTLRFGSGITLASVSLAGNAIGQFQNLFMTIGGAGDSISLAGGSAIDRFEFGDGTSMSLQEFVQASGGVKLSGSDADDTLSSLGLFSVLDGGPGNDELLGSTASTTYRFDLGDGMDFIRDAGGLDGIAFGQGIGPDDISWRYDASLPGGRFTVDVGSGGDEIVIADGEQGAIERFRFADGSELSFDALLSRQGGLPTTSKQVGLIFDGGSEDYVSYLAGTAGPDFIFDFDVGHVTYETGRGNDYLEIYQGEGYRYVFNIGDGQDVINTDDAAIETMVFGPGVTPESVRFALTTQSYRRFNENGADQFPLETDEGLHISYGDHGDSVFIVYGSFAYSHLYDIERFEFADGRTFSQFGLISLNQPGPLTAAGQANGVTLTEGDDVYRVYTDSAGTLVGSQGEDVSALGGNDRVTGGGGADIFDGGGGNDILQGGAGEDELYADASYSDYANDLLDGGDGFDYLDASLGNDLLIGGTGDDVSYSDVGNDVFLFNRGDGRDEIRAYYSETVAPELRADTLSLGGGIGYADLALSRRSDHLFLDTGQGEFINLYDWYYDAAEERTLSKLQLILDERGDYDPNAVDPLRNQRVQVFDFAEIVRQFDEASAQSPSIERWAVAGSLASSHLGGANDAAYGGDLAYVYATNGGYGALSNEHVMATLSDAAFGGLQTFSAEMLAEIASPAPASLSFALGSGTGAIANPAVPSTLVVEAGISITDFNVERDGVDLLITHSNLTDELRVQDWYAIGNGQFLELQFDDGSVISSTALTLASLTVNGPDGGGTLVGLWNQPNTLSGGTGNDVVTGGIADDRISGGAGNDTLSGGAGSNTYLYNVGDGVDTIIDIATPDAPNSIEFGPGITPGMITLGLGSLLLRIGHGGDAIHLEGFDPSDAGGARAVENFRFADGTRLAYDELLARGFDLTGTVGDDFIYGTNLSDRIDGLGGNDVLEGGAGSDTYVFGAGSGQDAIREVAVVGDLDTLQVLTNPNDVTVVREDSDIVVSLDGTSDRVAIDWFTDPGARIEQVSFADGTIWDGATLEARTQVQVNRPPVVANAIIDQDANEDSVFSFIVPATTFDDPDAGDTLTYTATLNDGSALPAWLGFDAGAREFSGTPTNDDVGTLNVRVTATDGSGESIHDDFALEVSNTNDAPVVATAIIDQNVDEDSEFIFTVPANAFDDVDLGDALTYSATHANGNPLPAWIGFDAGTREFSGTPSNDDVGTLNVRVTATDGSGESVSDEFALEVLNTNDAPIVANAIIDQDVDEDSEFGFIVPSATFEDVDIGDTLTYSATLEDGGELPEWLSFDTVTRHLTGTPGNADVGIVDVRVGATDTGGENASDSFRLTVRNVNDAPVAGDDAITVQADGAPALVPFATLLMNDGDIDAGDSLSLTATTASLSGAVVSIDAAGGNVIYDAGELFRTLGQGQSAVDAFGYTVEDLSGEASTATVSVTVNGVNDAPVVTHAIADQTALEDNVFSFQLLPNVFRDVDTGDVLNYSAHLADGSALPVWLDFDGTTRAFSGMPAYADAGAITIRVTATDGLGLSVADDFDLEVVLYPDLVLAGGPGNDVLIGHSGNDVLDGGPGNDTMIGAHGNDTYFVDSSGDIVIEGANAGMDKVITASSYTLGDNLENLTLVGDRKKVDATGNASDNVLVGNNKNNTLTGLAGHDWLDGGGGDDKMAGGEGDDTYVVNKDKDKVIENAGEGIDTVRSSIDWDLGDDVENLTLVGTDKIDGKGNALDNLLVGNSAKNKLDGEAGNDIMQGLAGDDDLKSKSGVALFDGGTGKDKLDGSRDNELYIGGAGDDEIKPDKGADIVAFNRGDGRDKVRHAHGGGNTLSLGGGIGYDDLSLTRDHDDLIFETGDDEQINFVDWYDGDHKSLINLQVIAEAMAEFDAGSSDPLLNRKVQTFNFAAITAAFDAAGQVDNWSLTNALLDAHLSASDTEALGGDLAYQYGLTSSLSGIGVGAAQQVLNAPQFGSEAQSLSPYEELQQGTTRLV